MIFDNDVIYNPHYKAASIDYTTFFLYFDGKMLFRQKTTVVFFLASRNIGFITQSYLFTHQINIYFPPNICFVKTNLLVTIWIFIFSPIFDVVFGSFLGHYKNFVRAFWKIKTLYYDKWNLHYVYWWING